MSGQQDISLFSRQPKFGSGNENCWWLENNQMFYWPNQTLNLNQSGCLLIAISDSILAMNQLFFTKQSVKLIDWSVETDWFKFRENSFLSVSYRELRENELFLTKLLFHIIIIIEISEDVTRKNVKLNYKVLDTCWPIKFLFEGIIAWTHFSVFAFN